MFVVSAFLFLCVNFEFQFVIDERSMFFVDVSV